MTEKTAVQRQRKFQKEDKGLVDEAVRALLNTHSGRKFLWWLLGLCRDGETPFTGNALTTAFACGHDNVARALKARLIDVAPDGYINLLKETQDEHRRRTESVERLGSDESG